MPATTASADPFACLATALRQNTDDLPERTLRVRGKLPAALDGVLYRNGPGLFRRSGRSNTTVLDGDDFVQRLRLHGRVARAGRRHAR